MGEFEHWKAHVAVTSNEPLQVLPEFKMEQNMPVEDDDNLEKEEW